MQITDRTINSNSARRKTILKIIAMVKNGFRWVQVDLPMWVCVCVSRSVSLMCRVVKSLDAFMILTHAFVPGTINKPLCSLSLSQTNKHTHTLGQILKMQRPLSQPW